MKNREAGRGDLWPSCKVNIDINLSSNISLNKYFDVGLLIFTVA